MHVLGTFWNFLVAARIHLMNKYFSGCLLFLKDSLGNNKHLQGEPNFFLALYIGKWRHRTQIQIYWLGQAFFLARLWGGWNKPLVFLGRPSFRFLHHALDAQRVVYCLFVYKSFSLRLHLSPPSFPPAPNHQFLFLTTTPVGIPRGWQWRNQSFSPLPCTGHTPTPTPVPLLVPVLPSRNISPQPWLLTTSKHPLWVISST